MCSTVQRRRNLANYAVLTLGQLWVDFGHTYCNSLTNFSETTTALTISIPATPEHGDHQYLNLIRPILDTGHALPDRTHWYRHDHLLLHSQPHSSPLAGRHSKAPAPAPSSQTFSILRCFSSVSLVLSRCVSSSSIIISSTPAPS